MDPGFYDYDDGITAVDALYERPRLNAIHLLVEGGRAAIIDTGTAHAAPRVLDVLRGKGVPPESVDYVILTHVHLDHAGGAGQLMAQCPNAVLTVHPWEVDPDPPRVRLPLRQHFAHYHSLAGFFERLRTVLRSVPFSTLEAVARSASPL